MLDVRVSEMAWLSRLSFGLCGSWKAHAMPSAGLLFPDERTLAVDASDRASPTAAEIFEGRDFEREDLLLAG